MAIKSVDASQVEAGFLTFDKGDLLILDDTAGQSLMLRDWGGARNARTNMTGNSKFINTYVFFHLKKIDFYSYS